MAKRFTPVIGLAVVVALALAAVFGAMSLTNPAFAAVGQPADAELAERTFSPQDAPDDFEATGDHSAVMLSWDEEGDSATGWNLEIKRDGDGESWQRFATVVTGTLTPSIGPYTFTVTVPSGGFGDVNSGTVSGLTNGTEYCFRLQYTEGTGADVSVSEVSDDCATPMRRPEQADDLEATPDDGQVTLEWDEPGDENIDSWQYTYGELTAEDQTPVSDDLDALNALDDDEWTDIPNSDDETDEYTVTGLGGMQAYWFAVRAVNGDTKSNPVLAENTTNVYYIRTTTTGEMIQVGTQRPATMGLPSFEADDQDPGKNTRYTLKFDVSIETNTLLHDLVIDLPDYGVPSSIGTSSVTITADVAQYDTPDEDIEGFTEYTFTPEDVSVDGNEIFISIGDVTEDTGGSNADSGIYRVGGTVNDDGDDNGDTGKMTVVIRQSAGVANPSAAGTFFAKEIKFGDISWKYDEDEEAPGTLEQKVPRIVSLDSGDGGLGTVVVATGKGFRKGTSMIVFIDEPSHQDDDDDPTTDARDDDGTRGEDTMVRGTLDLGEDTLCTDQSISSDSIGTCEFIVTHPTFDGGINYINAVDGRNGYINKPDDVDGDKPLAERRTDDLIVGDGKEDGMTFELAEFELTASVKATPEGGSPGEIIQLQVVDFPVGPIYRVEIGRQIYCGGLSPDGTSSDCTAAAVDSQGSTNFQVEIPNWVKGGIQELRVTGQKENPSDDDRVKASTNVTLVGPQINVTPPDHTG